MPPIENIILAVAFLVVTALCLNAPGWLERRRYRSDNRLSGLCKRLGGTITDTEETDQ
jgi:hypothetical protein